MILEVRGLNAWYGESHILHGIDFDVHEGEVATLLGRNGAGKTTTLKSIMGMVGRREGSIRFRGTEISKFPSNRVAIAGADVLQCEQRFSHGSLRRDRPRGRRRGSNRSGRASGR